MKPDRARSGVGSRTCYLPICPRPQTPPHQNCLQTCHCASSVFHSHRPPSWNLCLRKPTSSKAASCLPHPCASALPYPPHRPFASQSIAEDLLKAFRTFAERKGRPVVNNFSPFSGRPPTQQPLGTPLVPEVRIRKASHASVQNGPTSSRSSCERPRISHCSQNLWQRRGTIALSLEHSDQAGDARSRRATLEPDRSPEVFNRRGTIVIPPSGDGEVHVRRCNTLQPPDAGQRDSVDSYNYNPLDYAGARRGTMTIPQV